ncbi:MAG: hypothetical protein J3R72DRAFT_99922 [Linnemannia gamsii]|nr:MAG: hypothetical protein J3R72DRAFT_99922 [Linnemannia gamsii]
MKLSLENTPSLCSRWALEWPLMLIICASRCAGVFLLQPYFIYIPSCLCCQHATTIRLKRKKSNKTLKSMEYE